MSSKRREVHLTTLAKVAPGLLCPFCCAAIDSLTGLSDRGPAMPTTGALTMCAYCGTWLVLTQSFAAYQVFGVKIASKHEIESLKGTIYHDIVEAFVKSRTGFRPRG